jgi:Zn-dependent peptidase ImmA (M78 family)/transcriptional regulator with XRE-family HTH domain
VTAQFNNRLLLLARQFRQASQADVAKEAGLNQGHYSRIENGLTADQPSPENVERIASVLGFPVEFFYQDDGLAGLPLSVHAFNRKNASVSEKSIKQIHAELNIRLMHLRRYLYAIDLAPDLPRPFIDVDEGGGPREIARTMRRAWSVVDGPIPNLTDLCERAGIVVVWCDFDAPVDGVTMSVRDLPSCIFLNSRAPADRMRFSLAHELGHVIMHRVPTDDMEDEANAFAAELLVPEKAFRRSLIGQKITLEWLARQKAYWRVSMAFLVFQAGVSNLITRHQSEYLWMKFSALGWKTSEPEETSFPAERPTVFPGIVRFHAENLNYGVDELRNLLNAGGADIRRLYGVHLRGKDRLQVIK